MPIPTLGTIDGADLSALIDSLEKQRKELEFVLSSLDTQNIVELNADVINAGILNANYVTVRSDMSGGAYITIDGSGLYANDGTKNTFSITSDGEAIFTGRIVGGSIEADTTINVGTDLFVGDNIQLGDQAEIFDQKRLQFTPTTYISYYNEGISLVASLLLVQATQTVFYGTVNFDSATVTGVTAKFG